MLRTALILVLVLLTATRVIAESSDTNQEENAAILIADTVFVSNDGELVAEGNVEAFQGDTRLRASKIIYNRVTGQMTIQGPIVIQEGEDVTILADAAELDESLKNGLLSGARIVMNQQLQLAAVHIARTSGRYSQLYKTAVTSCKVCDDSVPPLWQIRAKRVVHDQEERQIYFEHAQFRVLDVPVLYLPKMRLPDPTVKRTSGFLVPSLRSTSQLSTGVRVPYFFTLGDHQDLTLAPYVSNKTRTLEFRYRRAYANGRLQLDGAFSRDDLRPGKNRGYLFAEGTFDLRNDFKLKFDVKATSDKAYLLDYDYTDTDRLKSEVSVSRTKRDTFVGAALTNFYSLRDKEDNAKEPSLIGEFVYDRRFFPAGIGGELRLGLNIHAHERSSDRDTDGPDSDDIVDGRDMTRFTHELEWLRGWTLASGLRADTRVGAAFDLYHIRQDQTHDSHVTKFTPHTALDLSYPLTRTSDKGAVQFLEPVIHVAWAGDSSGDIPNDESTQPEFDEGNLLALSRFPAPDRREHGLSAAYGINWARYDPDGWDARLTLGQVLRDKPDNDFTISSGLKGTSSDLLLAGQLKTSSGLQLTGRALFKNTLDFTTAEIRTIFLSDRLNVIGSYLWLVADPDESRSKNTSEFNIAGNFPINRNWSARANWRYDVEDNASTRAGAGLTYRNECVEIDLSVRKRFTSSSKVEPSTTFGFTVALRGFSADIGGDSYVRSCGKQAK